MSARPAVVSWSSGKDCTMALHIARQDPTLKVVGLLSTLDETAGRVAIHGTRRAILHAQAAALGLPLIEVDLPNPCPNPVYEDRIGAAVRQLMGQGVRDWIFGDLHLADIRAYREAQLAPLGITPHFPLWGQDTGQLARRMLAAGIAAHVVTLDPRHVPETLCGARFDETFLRALPDGVDPCGERGEFHTVVANGPGFARPLDLVRGRTEVRGGFVHTDFALAGAAGDALG